MNTLYWLRQSKLVVTPVTPVTPAGSDLTWDLSDLQFEFAIIQSDAQTPNNATIRVFNMADATVTTLVKAFKQQTYRVILVAGYANGPAPGTIFYGDIRQVRRGKMNATDTFFDILASDGYGAYNWGFISDSVAAGSTAVNRLATLQTNSSNAPTLDPSTDALTGGTLPRGKVRYGLWRDQVRDMALSTGFDWSIQNGALVLIPYQGYLPGTAVKLTSQTGLVGIPEQTEDGIRIRALLNPKMKIGGLVQVSNADINQLIQSGSNASSGATIPFNQYTGRQLLARTAEDGFYRILVAEHFGNTRGEEWYTELTCLVVDMTTNTTQG